MLHLIEKPVFYLGLIAAHIHNTMNGAHIAMSSTTSLFRHPTNIMLA